LHECCAYALHYDSVVVTGVRCELINGDRTATVCIGAGAEALGAGFDARVVLDGLINKAAYLM